MKKKTFEQSLERLNEIVSLLEKGEAPLEQSLKLFEEGAGLIQNCTTMLDAAEQKVVQLKKGGDGQPVEVPFAGQE